MIGLSENETVEVLESGLGNNGNWYKVVYKGTTGYVYGEYINLSGENTNQTTTNTTNNTNTNINETTTNTNNTPENNVVENTITNNEVVENNVDTNTTEPEPAENPEDTKTEPEVIPEIQINTYKTVNGESSLYIVPLVNASKIHTIKANEKLYVIQVLNGWAYVNSDNVSGWIRCSNLV